MDGGREPLRSNELWWTAWDDRGRDLQSASTLERRPARYGPADLIVTPRFSGIRTYARLPDVAQNTAIVAPNVEYESLALVARDRQS